MSEEHGGGGGNPYTFLFLLAGAMLAAVVFNAIRTGIPLTSALKNKIGESATVSSAPVVSTRNTPVPSTPTASNTTKKKAVTQQDHWTTITLDQEGHVISVLHY